MTHFHPYVMKPLYIVFRENIPPSEIRFPQDIVSPEGNVLIPLGQLSQTHFLMGRLYMPAVDPCQKCMAQMFSLKVTNNWLIE